MKTTIKLSNKIKMAMMILALSGLSLTSPAIASANAGDPDKKTVPALNASVRQLDNLKFRVSVNQPVAEKVRVKVMGGNNTVLYVGTLSSAEQAGRVFDLSQLADGAYTFEVTAGDQKFTQTFKLKTEVNRVVLAAN